MAILEGKGFRAGRLTCSHCRKHPPDEATTHVVTFEFAKELAGEIGRLRGALKAIMLDGCEKSTTGIGWRFQNGKTPDAEFGDDQCCNSCIAHKALGR